MSLTSTSPAPTPTPFECNPQGWYSINTTGMTGTVCGISAPPTVFNISSCCVSNWRVKYNCTQWCETHDIDDFGACANGDRTERNYTSLPYDTFCTTAGAEETGAASKSGPTLWACSALFLAVSSIAFGMASC